MNPQTDSVLKQVASLPRLSFKELQEMWRSLIGSEPPAYNKKFMVKRLAHRIQELAYGGPSEAMLIALAKAHRWRDLLDSGKALSIAELAERLGQDPSYIARTPRLSF